MTHIPTFTFYTDPGHGWLEVRYTDIAQLGLTPGMFSPYSYRRGEWFFLEEDCDATLFILAFEAKYGVRPMLRDSYSEHSPVRSYTRLAGEDYSFEKMSARVAQYQHAIQNRAA